MENVDGMEILLMKRAMVSQNRAKRCIFCDRKGTFRKSLLQKGFLTQNRAQKGKRAIRARLAWIILVLQYIKSTTCHTLDASPDIFYTRWKF